MVFYISSKCISHLCSDPIEKALLPEVLSISKLYSSLSFAGWIFYINLVETDGQGGIYTDMRVPAAGLVSSAGGTNTVNTVVTTFIFFDPVRVVSLIR
jgi:hypothetical protein